MMKDYFQRDNLISLNLKDAYDVLDDAIKPVEPYTNSVYNSRLIYNQKKPEVLYLTIYYSPSEYLYEKLSYLKENGVKVLQFLGPKPVENKWQIHEIFDFSESNLILIEGSNYWEHDKKPVVLTIDNMHILINSSYEGDGRFQLTENVFQHMHEHIRYGLLGRDSLYEPFIYSDSNKQTNFGPINFILSFEHNFDNISKYDITISRDAYLIITDDSDNLLDNEIIAIGEHICLIMSFYWQKNIDYFNARIRANRMENYRTRQILKFSNHSIDESQDYLLKERYPNFYDFIAVVDFNLFIHNLSLFRECTNRIIKSKDVDDTSAFMILYNIIEKIRNYCMEVPIAGNSLKIKEEYTFKRGVNATDRFIKEKIKEIKEIVDEAEAETFVSKASDKVNFIKKTGLIDQFDNLLVYLSLSPEKYDLNFKKLIQTRNNIYHGKLPNEDVRAYNIGMKSLIYDMMLKLVTA
ncbi:hypothetical protein [Rufibacter roseus]|uniref:Apea-like HEPN domain-containing protein n=1 Tax=Rufibacter roseus TaxID=1567108 RepID=A0ABW2DIF3_9BACT|nr:hypothetical protein [Rufibacter roseus]